MSVFDKELLNRFAQNCEDDFHSDFNCIVDRFALPIISGTSLYTLDDWVVNIRRITYLGWKVYPLSHRDFRDYILPVSSTGRPLEYVYNNVGLNTIKLFPAPSLTIDPVIYENSSELFKTENILTQCIVEYYRAPDYFDFTIPLFFKRRLVKAYVLWMCFQTEGKGQNEKAAAYWQKRYKALKRLYGEALQDLINRPRKLFASGNDDFDIRQRRPMLPIDKFGISTGPDGLE